MKTDLDELEALARAATPGPWCEHPNGTSVWSGEMYDTEGKRPQRHLFNALRLDDQAVYDTMFVAAANPEAILELIALVRSCHIGGDFTSGTKLRLFMPGRTMHDLPCTMVTYVHDARYEYIVRLGSGELWPAHRRQLVLDES